MTPVARSDYRLYTGARTQRADAERITQPRKRSIMADTYLGQLLGNDEKILYVTRRHWLVLVGEIASEAVLTIALAVLISLLLALWPPAMPWAALGYLL